MTKIIRIAALTALFFLLAYMLPINRAGAAEADLYSDVDSMGFPLLPHEKADKIISSKPKESRFTDSATQNNNFDDVDVKERQAAMTQLAIGAIGGAIYSPLGHALNMIQQPIKGKSMSCRSRLSINTVFLRCGLKF